jgi:hypothetical protein
MLIREFLVAAHPRQFFLETWRQMDDECLKTSGQRGIAFNWRPLIVAVVLSASMLTVFSIGTPSHFLKLSTALGFTGQWLPAPWKELAGYVWWSCMCLLLYLVLPALIIRVGWKEQLSEFGLGQMSLRSCWGYCLLALIAMVPSTFLAATHNTVFLNYYPMYPYAARSWADLLVWELFYVVQFLAIEFLFRGFALSTLRLSMGSQAIFVSTIPYAIAHIGKPLPEALGSIAAGIFLATLAVKSGSIWSGFLIHTSVAMSMDMAALVAKNQLPSQWWPAA